MLDSDHLNSKAYEIQKQNCIHIIFLINCANKLSRIHSNGYIQRENQTKEAKTVLLNVNSQNY